MRRPTRNTLLAGIWAAASVATVSADGTLAFSGDAGDVGRGGHHCHRSFPAFLWAGSNAGEQIQAGYQHAATEAHDLAAMVVDAASSAKDLEVVVIVLSQGSSFSTSGFSDANAVAVSKADSSLHARSATSTFPYTYPGASTLNVAVPVLAGEMGAPVQSLSLAEVVPTAVESGMLTDGKLDFVMVTVPATNTVQETDAAVHGITSTLEEASNGRFMLLWTGDMHNSGCGRRTLEAQAVFHRRLQTVALVTSSREIKMTPDILAGVLTLVLFLFIIMMGFGCVGDIECPQSFATVPPATGKEY